MPNQQLMDFIKDSRAAGQTDEQIKAVLKQNGWQDVALEEALRPQVPQMPQPILNVPSTLRSSGSSAVAIEQKGSAAGKIVISVLAVILIAGVAATGYYYFFVLNKIQSVSSPVQTAASTQGPLPIAEQSSSASTNAVGPKDTLLAMAKDFNLLTVGKQLQTPEEVLPFLQGPRFVQFLDTYMTAGSIKEFNAMSDIGKSVFFMFGLVIVLPDSSSNINEVITGNTATLSYSRDEGTFGDTKTGTKLTATCTLKMVLEGGSWKWNRSPLIPDNIICTTSGTQAVSTTSSSSASNIIPTVSSISPESGPAGTSITVRGTGFSSLSKVSVGAIIVTPTSVSSDGTKLSFIFPLDALNRPADYYAIEISNGVGRSDNQKMFTLVLPAAH